MAQSVEQLIRNQQVAGSNPASSSKNVVFFGNVFFVAKVPIIDLYMGFGLFGLNLLYCKKLP